MEWVSLSCADNPPRNSHSAVLDGDAMIIIGGASPDGQTDDVLAIDLSDRSHLNCVRVSCRPSESGACVVQSDSVGGVPAARDMHSACVYKSELIGGAGATILIMGGRSSAGVLQDLFSLNTGTVIEKPALYTCFQREDDSNILEQTFQRPPVVPCVHIHKKPSKTNRQVHASCCH